MEQHILSILKESNTIIIPNLGALTITNQTTGEIMFMPYLKYDDGKLSTYIAEQEGISSDEAKSKITNFTEAILNKLATVGKVEVTGIGTFTKGADDIEFSHNAEQEATKIEPVTIQETTTQETLIEEKAIETIEESSITEQVNSEIEDLEETTETETETKTENNPEILNETKEESPVLDTESTQQDEIVEPTPEASKEDKKAALKAEKEAKAKAEKEAKEKAKAEKEAKIKAEKEAKAKAKAEKKKGNTPVEGEEGQPKKKKKLIPLLIVLLLVLSGGAYIALNFEHLKDKIPFLSHKEHTTGEGNEKEETEAKTEEKQEKAEGKHENSNSNAHSGSTSGTFYIILGTYGEKVNAEGLAERLNMEGISSATVIERDGNHSVVYNQYSSKDAALSDLESARTKFPKAWIFTAN